MTLKVAIHGAMGRMGRRLCLLTHQNPSCSLVAALEHRENKAINKPLDDYIPEIKIGLLVTCEWKTQPDVIIDFSTPTGTLAITNLAVEKKIPIIIGTTGFTEHEKKLLYANTVLSNIGMVHAMNYSVGVNLVQKLVEDAAHVLGKGFDVEIVESHHNRKVDAPSGTAISLLDSIQKTDNHKSKKVKYGRGQGAAEGARPEDEIGVHSLRMGSVVGEHSVHFTSGFESVILEHKAYDRDVFAAGAIECAIWLAKQQKPGLFSMRDFLAGSSLKK